MPEILFSILYASCRPKEIQKHLNQWLEKTNDLSAVEMILAVDELDTESVDELKAIVQNSANFKFGGLFCSITPAPHRNCIVAWNTAAKVASGKIIIATSDDFDIPKDWDVMLKNIRCNDEINWWDHYHVVHTNDGFTSVVHGICTFPIVTRFWYEKYRYIYHPSYIELFGDQELCEVAYRDNAMIKAFHIDFTHRHYCNEKRPYDKVDEKHNSREAWVKDENNFKARKEAGFPD